MKILSAFLLHNSVFFVFRILNYMWLLELRHTLFNTRQCLQSLLNYQSRKGNESIMN
jgi:hypothetical protein